MDQQEALEKLKTGIAELTTTEQWTAWLNFHRKLYNYSAGNTILIWLQRPDATMVAGFHNWLKLQRCVRKGEKGIAILAPVVKRTRIKDEVTGDETVVVGSPRAFRVVHVFDVAQTDGAEIPEAPVHRLTGEDNAGRFRHLLKVAASIGFSVEFSEFFDDRNGDCSPMEKRIRIRVELAEAQAVKTLAHELGHALAHPVDCNLPRELKELEAESIAYLVCDGLDLDTSSYSFGYVAGWLGGGDEAVKAISACAQRITKAARVILDGGLAEDIAADAA